MENFYDQLAPFYPLHVMRSRYYAISSNKLLKLMAVAGFVDLKRLDDVYFQPIIIGTNPSPNFPH